MGKRGRGTRYSERWTASDLADKTRRRLKRKSPNANEREKACVRYRNYSFTLFAKDQFKNMLLISKESRYHAISSPVSIFLRFSSQTKQRQTASGRWWYIECMERERYQAGKMYTIEETWVDTCWYFVQIKLNLYGEWFKSHTHTHKRIARQTCSPVQTPSRLSSLHLFYRVSFMVVVAVVHKDDSVVRETDFKYIWSSSDLREYHSPKNVCYFLYFYHFLMLIQLYSLSLSNVGA